MAKFTKSDLKSILKECILEILKEESIVLQEATGGNMLVTPVGKSNNRNKGNVTQLAQSIVDRAMIGESPPQTFSPDDGAENPVLLEKVNLLSKTFGNNKQGEMMQSIFADTALTTLQEQETGITVQQTERDDVQLEKLSGGGDITRWAQVAFAPMKSPTQK